MADRYDTIASSLARLQAATAEVLGRHGLHLDQFVVSAEPDGSLAFQVLASLADDDDDAETTDRFDEVLRSAHEAEVAERAERARQDLVDELRRLGPEGGIL